MYKVSLCHFVLNIFLTNRYVAISGHLVWICSKKYLFIYDRSIKITKAFIEIDP